jgi:hypothetical protein
MFSFFKRLAPAQNTGPDSTPPETDPTRMTLAERMAHRREMLYQSIRESLLQLQVISSMYRFRVMNLDPRHHRFVAMIEVTNNFSAKVDGMSAGFSQIEDYIKKRAAERYGVTLEGIFWRVNEEQDSFVRSYRAGERPKADNAPRQREVVGDVSGARQRLARAQVEPVTAEEAQAFARALQAGGQPDAMSGKHLNYESELAALQSAEPSGGTQYGPL